MTNPSRGYNSAKAFKVPDDEVEVLGGLPNGILKYDPKEQIDMEDVLIHNWFKGQYRITTVSDEETCSILPAEPIHDLLELSIWRRYCQKAQSSQVVVRYADSQSQYLIIGLTSMALIYATLRIGTSHHEIFGTPSIPPRVGTYTPPFHKAFYTEARICVLPDVFRRDRGG